MRENDIRDRVEDIQLDIGKIIFSIEFQSQLLVQHATIAQVDFFGNRIIVEPDLHERDMLTAILHEAIETIFKQYNLSTPHDVIATIERAMFQFMIDNVEFLELIVGEAKKGGNYKIDQKAINERVDKTLKEILEGNHGI